MAVPPAALGLHRSYHALGYKWFALQWHPQKSLSIIEDIVELGIHERIVLIMLELFAIVPTNQLDLGCILNV